MGKIILVSVRQNGSSSSGGCSTCGANSAAVQVSPQKVEAQMKKLAPQPQPKPQPKIETQPETQSETTDHNEQSIAGITLDVWRTSTAARVARMALRKEFEEYIVANEILQHELISKMKEVELVKAIKEHHNI